MRTLAVSLVQDHDIYEIDLKQNSWKKSFGAFGSAKSLCFNRTTFFYLGGSTDRAVYKRQRQETYVDDVYLSNLSPDHHLLPMYEHDTWIRRIRIRHDDPRKRFYFSAYRSETTVTIYFLDEMDNPVEYCTIEGSQLPIPDPCQSGAETSWSSWSGEFAFDESGNLYVATGNYQPSALYRISGAGFEGVTGQVERIVVYDDGIYSLSYGGDNQLIYLHGNNRQQIHALQLATMESSLVCDLAQFTSKEVRAVTWLDLPVAKPRFTRKPKFQEKLTPLG